MSASFRHGLHQQLRRSGPAGCSIHGSPIIILSKEHVPVDKPRHHQVVAAIKDRPRSDGRHQSGAAAAALLDIKVDGVPVRVLDVGKQ